MKKGLRIVMLMLALCQIISCFAGCKKEELTPEESSVEDTAEQVPFELTVEALSKYTIIVPENDPEGIGDAAIILQLTLQNIIGKKLDIKTDKDAAESDYEILVGLVDRAEATEFYKKVKQYNSGYALIGKKLLLIGRIETMASESVIMFTNMILDMDASEAVILKDGDNKLDIDNLLQIDYEWFEKSKKKYYSEDLEGLTINAIGDSYFGGSDLGKDKTWLALLSKKYNIDMNNYGIGGSTVSNYVTEGRNPMCDRYQKMANNNPDIVILEGGRNDFSHDVSIGDVDSRDTTTFSGALNVIIDGLKEKYPNAMIICLSNWNFPDTKFERTYTDYAYAMEAVAEKQGVYFIAAYDPAVSGVDMSKKSFREMYCLKATDVSHLNYAGMKLTMEYLEKAIANCYKDFISKK